MIDPMQNDNSFTRSEIASQPQVWTSTLNKFQPQFDSLAGGLRGLRSRPFLVIGCGSTYYLSLHAASVLRALGVDARAQPSSELVFYPQVHLVDSPVLLVISRSGTTSESLWGMDAYRKADVRSGVILSISCVPDTPLIAGSDLALLSEFAREQSVAQTRSFSSMAVMTQILAAGLVEDRSRMERLAALPGLLERILQEAGDLPGRLGRDLSLERFFYLGNGPYYGLACEMMLKTKEMTTSWSEAYHTLEFRHGPMSVVNANALVVGLISDSAQAEEVQVLREMKAKGARTLALCERRGDQDWSGVDDVVEIRSGLSEWERGALYLPAIQWLAYHRALAKGLDPDHPVNLSQVIELGNR
jgi:glucosamine--fructose-6-phosphate aminotransferase (isomerizing)